MLDKRPIGTLSELSAPSLGVFHSRAAVKLGVSRKQLAALRAAGVIERELPEVYRMTVVARSAEQRLRAALMWAGDESAAAGLSAGELYNLQGVHAPVPEIVVPASTYARSKGVSVHRSDEYAALMT
jgi:hypothetical protein